MPILSEQDISSLLIYLASRVLFKSCFPRKSIELLSMATPLSPPVWHLLPYLEKKFYSIHCTDTKCSQCRSCVFAYLGFGTGGYYPFVCLQPVPQVTGDLSLLLTISAIWQSHKTNTYQTWHTSEIYDHHCTGYFHRIRRWASRFTRRHHHHHHNHLHLWSLPVPRHSRVSPPISYWRGRHCRVEHC